MTILPDFIVKQIYSLDVYNNNYYEKNRPRSSLVAFMFHEVPAISG